jgi:uncharacterized membrane protein
MNNHYPPHVQKIVNDYLERVKGHLKGMPDQDQQESVQEIKSHIYESYANDKTEDEVDRILNVLRKLGEPSKVFSEKMPDTMVKMGKSRNLPLYILSGVLIGLFGIPIGVTGIGIIFSILGAVVALVAAYFFTAVGLIAGGFFGMVVSIIRIADPAFLDQFLERLNIEIMHPFYFSSPVTEGIIGLIASMLIGVVGVLMLIFGKYIFRGMRFLYNVSLEKIKDFRKKK